MIIIKIIFTLACLFVGALVLGLCAAASKPLPRDYPREGYKQ